jgi:hypothetical protein
MKNAVIVVSAIMIPDMEDIRFTQTIHTFDSIFLRIPNASIFLVECSLVKLSDFMKKKIEQYGVTIIEMHDHQKIHDIKNKSIDLKNKSGYIKNLTEIYAINYVLNNFDFMKFDRISKLSGRYFLDSNFNWKNNEEDMFTTSITYQSPRYENEYARQCTYWSLPVKNIEDYKDMFRLIQKWLISSWDEGIERDIEHGIYLFLELLKIPVRESHPLGVSGLTDGKTLNMH